MQAPPSSIGAIEVHGRFAVERLHHATEIPQPLGNGAANRRAHAQRAVEVSGDAKRIAESVELAGVAATESPSREHDETTRRSCPSGQSVAGNVVAREGVDRLVGPGAGVSDRMTGAPTSKRLRR